jgi:ribosomal protein S18 acetylase RimI-like enzyme
MKIRKGKLGDLEEIYKILNNTKELHGMKDEKEEYPKQSIRETLIDKRESVLIAEENKKIVGLLIAEIWKKKKFSYLVDIFVKPEYRKKGVASILTKEHEKRCKKEGMIDLIALVLVDNKKMQSFMKKHNYKQGNKFYYYTKELK